MQTYLNSGCFSFYVEKFFNTACKFQNVKVSTLRFLVQILLSGRKKYDMAILGGVIKKQLILMDLLAAIRNPARHNVKCFWHC
jgi:hypothetical protein